MDNEEDKHNSQVRLPRFPWFSSSIVCGGEDPGELTRRREQTGRLRASSGGVGAGREHGAEYGVVCS